VPIDYSLLKFGKAAPRVAVKAVKAKAEDAEWRRVCKRVDDRDKKVCQVTRASLTAGAVDPWTALERHHLEYRSQNAGRKLNDRNVWTVSRAIHQLIHSGALRVLTKTHQPAKDVRDIYAVAWNRNVIAKGQEPCRIRMRTVERAA
jgi:hypothetical protein